MNDDFETEIRFREAAKKGYEERALQNVKVLLSFFREKTDMKVKVYSSLNYKKSFIAQLNITKKSDCEIVFSAQDSAMTNFIDLTGKKFLNTTDPELLLEVDDEKIFFTHGERTYFERAE